MEETKSLIYQTEWWVTAVIAGVLINLLSDFIKTFIKKKYASTVKSWSTRSNERKSNRERRIDFLAASDHELYIAMLELNQKKMQYIFEYVQAITFLIFGITVKEAFPIIYTILCIGAALSMFYGLKAMISHGEEDLVVLEARFKSQEKHNKKQLSEM